MNKKIVEYIAVFYEILLRLLVFLAISYEVTKVFSESILTGALWTTLSHWMFGGAQAVLALLFVIPFFAPESVMILLSDYYLRIGVLRKGWNKVPELFDELKDLTFEQRLIYLKRYVDAMEIANGHEELKEPLKVLRDAFELAEAIILEKEGADKKTGNLASSHITS